MLVWLLVLAAVGLATAYLYSRSLAAAASSEGGVGWSESEQASTPTATQPIEAPASTIDSTSSPALAYNSPIAAPSAASAATASASILASDPSPELVPTSPEAAVDGSFSNISTCISLDDISDRSARVQEVKAERRRLGLSGKQSPVVAAPSVSVVSQASQESPSSIDRALRLRKAERQAARDERRRRSGSRASRLSARDGDGAPPPHSNRHRHDVAKKIEFLRKNPLPPTALPLQDSASATPLCTAEEVDSVPTARHFSKSILDGLTSPPADDQPASAASYAEYHDLTQSHASDAATLSPSTFTD